MQLGPWLAVSGRTPGAIEAPVVSVAMNLTAVVLIVADSPDVREGRCPQATCDWRRGKGSLSL